MTTTYKEKKIDMLLFVTYQYMDLKYVGNHHRKKKG